MKTTKLSKMQEHLLSEILHCNAEKKEIAISVGRYKTNPNILLGLEKRGLIIIRKRLSEAGTYYCKPA